MKIKNLLLATILLAGTATAAEIQGDKFDARGKMMLRNIEKMQKSDQLMQNTNLKFPYSIKNNKLTVSLELKVEGNNPVQKLEALGCKVKVHTNTIFYVEAPVDQIDDLQAMPEVKQIRQTGTVKLSMDQSKKAINAETVTASGLTENNIIAGEGVLVGVVDTGIDLSHPDFSDENGTRVLYYWDTDADEAPGAPKNFDWGTEYSKEYIDANLSSITNHDSMGHGTHVTGTAAGNGTVNAAYRGIASNANIIGVRLSSDDGVGEGMTNENIIAACQYVVEKAKELGKPVAINLSLGETLLTGYDGTDLMSQALNEMSGPGVIFSVAAGNEGTDSYHAGTTLAEGQSIILPVYMQNMNGAGVMNESENDNNLFYNAADVWYQSDITDSMTVSIYDMYSIMFGGNITPEGSYTFCVNDPDFENAEITGSGSAVGYLNVVSAQSEITPEQKNILLTVHNGNKQNMQLQYKILAVEVTGKKAGPINMWAYLSIPKDQVPMDITIPGKDIIWSDYAMTIGAPGLADSAVCVGAFNTKNSWTNAAGSKVSTPGYKLGDIADFSSTGPSRDGRILPTITAPGYMIASAKSSSISQQYLSQFSQAGYMTNDEKYMCMPGTSMATPHITGTLALMLQVNPKLSAREAIDILQATATVDEFTGNDLPNSTWGAGKVNVQKAINYMLGASAKDYVMANDVKVYPMPANAEINVDLDAISLSNSGDLFVVNSIGARQDVPFELNGGKLKLNISSLASGIYVGEYRTGETVSRFKFVKK